MRTIRWHEYLGGDKDVSVPVWIPETVLGSGMEGGVGDHLRAAGRVTLPLALRTRPLIAFYVANDTHVRTFAPVAARCRSFSDVMFMRRGRDTEGIQRAWDELEMPWRVVDARRCLWPSSRRGRLPDVLVTAIDWSYRERGLVRTMQRRRVLTAVAQEGCLDFWDARERLGWADIALIQGWNALASKPRGPACLVGNPRITRITESELAGRRADSAGPLHITLNANFTYGVYSDAAEAWLADVRSACEELGYSYSILHHPRDGSRRIPGVSRDSSASVLPTYLKSCDIFISRFSTAIYEAAALGAEVIYHNPHGEHMQTFQNDESGFLWKTRTRDHLLLALKRLGQGERAFDVSRETFLRDHVSIMGVEASEAMASALLLLTQPKIWRRAVDRRPSRGRITAKELAAFVRG